MVVLAEAQLGVQPGVLVEARPSCWPAMVSTAVRVPEASLGLGAQVRQQGDLVEAASPSPPEETSPRRSA